MSKDEEIAYLRNIIKEHLSPFEAEGVMDVGPCFDYWYCPICQQMAYWDKNKINHKTDCYWKKEKENE
jgi:hypothetical protein